MLIKTYKGKHVFQPHFFILNKANNCGKPLTAACANCFVCLLDTEEEKQFHYWLLYALWQTSQFDSYLCGSVIPFIHIKDVKSVVANAAIKANNNLKKYHKALDLLIEINKREGQLKQQIKVITNAKRILLREVLK